MTADPRLPLERLSGTDRRILGRVAAVALALGAEPFVVGGTVRDLLLGRGTVDLDVVVVGDALDVATGLGTEPGVTVLAHERFGTAKIAWPDGRAIDLITARREEYAAPGALPTVAPGGVDDDLRRRDFTINAMAASLRPATLGALVDPLGGRADLWAGHIRALHPESFRDDPTRMLRAVRYEGRLSALPMAEAGRSGRSFAIEPETLAWLRAAVDDGALRTVSVDRLMHEFARLLAEPAAAAMVERLAALDLLGDVHPALLWTDETRRAYADLDEFWPLVAPLDAVAPSLWAARLALLAAHLGAAEAKAVASALRLPAEARKLLVEVATLQGRVAGRPLGESPRDAALGAWLDPYSPAAIATVAALESDGPARSQLHRFLTVVRSLRPTLDGDALKELGLPPGPHYREALAELLARKRDDPTLTVEGEWNVLRRWLEQRDRSR